MRKILIFLIIATALVMVRHAGASGLQNERSIMTSTATKPLSDVTVNADQTAYKTLQQQLQKGRIPSPESVRIGDMVNAFHYQYSDRKIQNQSFTPVLSVLPSPWQTDHMILHIGMRACDKEKINIVKVQLEFNQVIVSDYRFIGDEVGQSLYSSAKPLTFMYEVKPTISSAGNRPDHYALLKIFYKVTGDDQKKMSVYPITAADDIRPVTVRQAPGLNKFDFGENEKAFDARFAVAVATFGELLKGGQMSGTATYDEVISEAERTKGNDKSGERAAFIELIRRAKAIE